ncbi:Multidrug resistance protein stp [Nonomuraea coxensis DSM 45129]|uniref:Multidrug resistance protein stp n=1 Tax=Nonomuraea coxensis DSM 45129 TaxID=1122611 RepID=A0ABX8TYR2_9ACTN|nr:MFS transporter [Nonomuraea coxensis]QYC40489.1 Multidrug resistance protein stp [Nonomuraea coxensis DSM 45129]
MRMFGFSLAYFLVMLDTTVLTVALPGLRDSLGGSPAGQQWAVNAYTVAFAAALLTGGSVADRYGAARVFKLGVAAFGGLSLLCAAAPHLDVLIAARALLGVAAALCTGGSFGLLAEMYSEPAARARATGVWAALTGTALAAGPLLGGLLVDLYGWRAVFLVNLPLAAVSLLAVRPVTSPRGVRGIDWRVQALAGAFLGLLAEAVIDASPVAGALAVAALAALVAAERRSPDPALPGGLLAATWPELLAGVVANFAFSGALFVLTLMFQDVRHLTPMAAGLAFLPLTLPMAVNPLLTGRLVARHGPRPPILAGLALVAAGLGGLALTEAVAPWLVVTGLGLSFVLPALMAGMAGRAPAGTVGTAGGVLNAFRQAGATLGVAVMGVIGRPLLAAAVLTALTCACYGLAAARARRVRVS